MLSGSQDFGIGTTLPLFKYKSYPTLAVAFGKKQTDMAVFGMLYGSQATTTKSSMPVHGHVAGLVHAAVNRSEAQSLLRKVTVREAAAPPFGPGEWAGGYVTVELAMTDGAAHQVRVDVPHGHDDDPLTESELHDKFTDCLAYGGGDWDAERLWKQLHDIDTENPFTGLAGVGREGD